MHVNIKATQKATKKQQRQYNVCIPKDSMLKHMPPPETAKTKCTRLHVPLYVQCFLHDAHIYEIHEC